MKSCGEKTGFHPCRKYEYKETRLRYPSVFPTYKRIFVTFLKDTHCTLQEVQVQRRI
jgi:hypothetical protein